MYMHVSMCPAPYHGRPAMHCFYPQELIGLDPRMLTDTMTVSVSVMRGETIRMHLNKEKAKGTALLATLQVGLN